MAEDYRNLSSKLFVRGLDLLHTPDSLAELKWSRLTNIENVVDGQLQQRPTVDLWDDYTTYQFTTGTCSSPALTLGVDYPYDYNFGGAWTGFSLRNVYYATQIDDNGTPRDGYIFCHDDEDTAGSFRWFLNGIPILLDTVWNGTAVTTQAKLVTPYDSVVLANTPNAQPIAIIGGQYYVSLSEVDLNAPSTAVINLNFYNSQELYTDCPGADYFPAYRLGIPKPVAWSVAPAQSGTAGSLTQTSGTGKIKGSTTYSWRYTYYNSVTGAESPPSASSDGIDITAASKSADMTYTNSTDPQVDKVRIYRKGGILTGSWRLVAEVANDASTATTAHNDGASDASKATAETIDVELVEPFPIAGSDGVSTVGTKLDEAFGPFLDKYVFYYGDAVNPHYVWWTQPNDPFRSHPDGGFNKIGEEGEEVKRGLIFNGQPYVFTNENLYAMEFAGPDALPAFSARKTPVEIGLACKYGVTQGDGAIYFVGRDGIYATDGQSLPINITDDSLKPLFFGTDRSDMDAIDWDNTTSKDMALTYSNKRLYFFYLDVGDTVHCAVLDLRIGAWYNWNWDQIASDLSVTGLIPESAYTSIPGTGAVNLPNLDQATTLILTQGFYAMFLDEHARGAATQLGSRSSEYGNAGNPDYGFPGEVLGQVCNARSASLDGGIPHTEKLYGTLIVDYDPDDIQITLTPYYDSEQTAGSAISLTPTAGRRVDSYDLGDIYAKSIALDFAWRGVNMQIKTGGAVDLPENVYTPGVGSTWNYYIPGVPKIYAITVLYRADEEEIVHWEHPEDSWGQDGWFHIRDGMFDINSNADVTLLLTVDGTVHTYTLASTSGARRKIYQEFDAIRSKVVKMELDSASPFRFYSDTSHLYVKKWQSDLGYKPVPLAGAAGYADFLRKGGGT